MPPRIRPSQVPEVPQPNRPGAKGRPTPKRKVAQAANRRPLVQDAKTSAKESRAKAREQRDREYQALRQGDSRNFPPRDQGPVRAWARDWVDARRDWREWAVPIAVVAFLLSIVSTANPYLYLIVNVLIWVLLVTMIVGSVLYVRKVKRLATAKFGIAKLPAGTRHVRAVPVADAAPQPAPPAARRPRRDRQLTRPASAARSPSATSHAIHERDGRIVSRPPR